MYLPDVGGLVQTLSLLQAEFRQRRCRICYNDLYFICDRNDVTSRYMVAIAG